MEILLENQINNYVREDSIENQNIKTYIKLLNSMGWSNNHLRDIIFYFLKKNDSSSLLISRLKKIVEISEKKKF